MMDVQQNNREESIKKHRRVALPLVVLVALMTGLAFASAPLYRLFCAATGYGGTTQRAAAPSGEVHAESITVRFDANTSSALKWDFRPEQREITLKIGENSLAFYRAVNHGATPLTGSATFNVTPEIAGSYFNKVECFCFTDTTLKGGETLKMPVVFYVDPAIDDVPELKSMKTITLSYTLFPVEPAPAKAVDATGKTGKTADENLGG